MAHTDDSFPSLVELASACELNVAENVDYLLKKRAKFSDANRLVVENWWSGAVTGGGPIDLSESHPHFDETLTENVTRALDICAGIKIIYLRGMMISPAFIEALAERCQQLTTILLDRCWMPVDLDPLELLATTPLTSVRLVYLHLRADYGFEASRIWRMMPLFTQATKLQVSSCYNEERGFLLPDGASYARFNPFIKAEKLQIEALEGHQMWSLNRWLLSVQAPLPLTHFKLSVRGVLDSVDRVQLTEGLRSAPMLQVLVIDGLIDASPEILQSFANGHDALVALTLILRDSWRQSKAKLCTWPGSTWEYAPALAAFPRLRHFGWNARIDLNEATPSIMQLFETDFAEQSDDEDVAWGYERSMYGDFGSMAAPFAVHCPTLETFAVVDEDTRRAFRVSRGPGGTAMAAKHDFNTEFDVIPWNPDSSLGWVFREQAEALCSA